MSQNSFIRSLLNKALVSFGVLIGLTPLFAQNNPQIKKSSRVRPNSVVAKPIFSDNFSTGTIAADKWRYGANTTYHYRVRSKDFAGNLAVSNDFVFTALVAPPLILTFPNGGEWFFAGVNHQIT